MKFTRRKKSIEAEHKAETQTGNEDNISKSLDININKIKAEIGSVDLIVNLSEINPDRRIQFACIYIDNLINNQVISSYSIELAEIMTANENSKFQNPQMLFNLLRNKFSILRTSTQSSSLDTLLSGLLSGELILLIDGCSEFISIAAYSPEERSVEEPTSQSIVRGPKDGFTEKLGVNIALIRKRICDKTLKIERLTIGRRTKTKVALMYINGLAKKEIIDEIRRRLNTIQIDGILESGYIEDLIKDNKYTVFPTFLNSEKPDTVSACLLEGKAAILVDGTPFVLTAPALFVEFFQASEDYYHQFHISTLVRLFRYLALVLSMFVPALYIALASFHQEMIPTTLLVNILSQHEGVPFPTTIEVLVMEVIFEILREAGIRMPRVIGPAISIVGALVLGQAAVEAGLISAIIVIIVSITAISSFAIPNYSMANAARLIRFILIFIAGAFGLMGVFLSTIALFLELCRLKSLGIPYMSPIAPKAKVATKDTIVRFPLMKNTARPEGVSADTSPRIKDNDIVSARQKEQPEFR